MKIGNVIIPITPDGELRTKHVEGITTLAAIPVVLDIRGLIEAHRAIEVCTAIATSNGFYLDADGHWRDPKRLDQVYDTVADAAKAILEAPLSAAKVGNRPN
jgi:hypothetical protein